MFVIGDFLYKAFLNWRYGLDNHDNMNDITEGPISTTKVMIKPPTKHRIDFDSIVRKSNLVCASHQRNGHRNSCNFPKTCRFNSSTLCKFHRRYGVGAFKCKSPCQWHSLGLSLEALR